MEERNDISHDTGSVEAGEANAAAGEAGASDVVETPATELTRSQRWEAQKQKEREEQEARYKDAPFLTKIFELYFGKPLVILSVLVALGVLVFAGMKLTRDYHERQAAQGKQEASAAEPDYDAPLSEENKSLIYEESPIDEEGAARIDAMAPVSADDTWTICVYMVGSDLEDMNENDLSYVIDVMIADKKEQIDSDRRKKLRSNIRRYTEELAGSGLDLPSYFFYPEKPVASSRTVTRDVGITGSPSGSHRRGGNHRVTL